MRIFKVLLLNLILMTVTIFTGLTVTAQQQQPYFRIAEIVVDAPQLEAYHTALKEQMTDAIKLEPGVLAYSALADKSNPTHITIFETYASVTAYENHIQTAHFKKYKATVAGMVKSLTLRDMVPIGIMTK
ncbi:putative quinol monooxygenase [Chitinophaga sp. Hz27]|uniref:putative quinol monooxygenase n=1 Tax=Chitinophaga sp. Hz27 TaxID=3347169 RepID=UPI0035DBE389